MKKIFSIAIFAIMLISMSTVVFANITMDEAINAAAEYVGCKKDEMLVTKQKTEKEKISGMLRSCIEIEFSVGNTDYEVSIDAETKTLYEVKIKNHVDGLNNKKILSDMLTKKVETEASPKKALTVDDIKNKVKEKLPQIDTKYIYVTEGTKDKAGLFVGQVFYDNKLYEFAYDKYTGELKEWKADENASMKKETK